MDRREAQRQPQGSDDKLPRRRGCPVAAAKPRRRVHGPPLFRQRSIRRIDGFCYVWLRRLVGDKVEGFDRPSTRSPDELTGNATEERGLEHFTEGLSAVYSRMAGALKPGAPLVFTYHHNKLEAYYAVGVAILDAGLVCSASLPCPAEMGGSIHIHGTASSIIDTVFVCRASGATSRRWLFETPEQLAAVVADDLERLESAGRKPTYGDRRCIVFGHLTRMAVWKLRKRWDPRLPTKKKLAAFAQAVLPFGTAEQLVERVATGGGGVPLQGSLYVADAPQEEPYIAVPF